MAVRIGYNTWLEVEAILTTLAQFAKKDTLHTAYLAQKRELLANQIQWTEGDGLEYQARLRSEKRSVWEKPCWAKPVMSALSRVRNGKSNAIANAT